jgi:hypothetical protein
MKVNFRLISDRLGVLWEGPDVMDVPEDNFIPSKNTLEFHGSDNFWYGKDRSGKENPMFGRKHSEEAKKKMSKRAKLRTNVEFYKNKKFSNLAKQRMIETNSKEWVFLDPNGQVVSFKNLEAYSREHGLNSVMMSRVFRGKIKCHKGYRKHGV